MTRGENFRLNKTSNPGLRKIIIRMVAVVIALFLIGAFYVIPFYLAFKLRYVLNADTFKISRTDVQRSSLLGYATVVAAFVYTLTLHGAKESSLGYLVILFAFTGMGALVLLLIISLEEIDKRKIYVNEGETWLLVLCVGYWVANKSFFTLDNGVLMWFLIILYVAFSALPFLALFTKINEKKQFKLVLSIATSLMILLLHIDTLMGFRLLSFGPYEAYVSHESMPSYKNIVLQALLLGASMRTILYNSVLIIGIIPSKESNSFTNKVVQEERKRLLEHHNNRYTDTHVHWFDALWVTGLVLVSFYYNSIYKLLPAGLLSLLVLFFVPKLVLLKAYLVHRLT